MKDLLSTYLRLIDYQSNALTSNGTSDKNILSIQGKLDQSNAQFINVTGFSTDIMQELNIGSQPTGAGAGKITFNPFKIYKPIDGLSPELFLQAASGTPFNTAEIFIVNAESAVMAMFTYKLVGIKTVAWSASANGSEMIETVTFEYGGLIITVNQYGADGTISNVLQGGWNRVRNVKDNDLTSMIS